MHVVEVGIKLAIARFAQPEGLPSTHGKGVVVGNVPSEVGVCPPQAVTVTAIGTKRVHATEHVKAVISSAESSVIPGGFFLFDHDGLFEGFRAGEEWSSCKSGH